MSRRTANEIKGFALNSVTWPIRPIKVVVVNRKISFNVATWPSHPFGRTMRFFKKKTLSNCRLFAPSHLHEICIINFGENYAATISTCRRRVDAIRATWGQPLAAKSTVCVTRVGWGTPASGQRDQGHVTYAADRQSKGMMKRKKSSHF